MPKSRCLLVLQTILHLITIPFILLLYPVWVLMHAMINPYYMPKKYRFLCFCKHYETVFSCCFCTCLIYSFFAPFIIIFGLIIGVFNCLIFNIPAIIFKIWKLLVMIFYWRCFCCLDRHK